MVKVIVVAVLASLSVLAGSASAGPLDAPQNLQAAWSGNQVVLTWDAVDGAPGYAVYRDGAFLDNAGAPSYSDSSAQSTTSVYWVTAILPEGESLPSNPANPDCWGLSQDFPFVYVNPEACDIPGNLPSLPPDQPIP